MTHRPKGVLSIVGLAVALIPHSVVADGAALDTAFDRYWQATSPRQLEDAAQKIVALDPDFDAVLEYLRQGRPYPSDAPKGRRILTRERKFHYILVVPDDYDPTRRYPVELYLHGGVSRPAFRADGSWWRGSGDPEPGVIAILPAAWDDAMWWEDVQVRNLDAIVTEVQRTYNLDENRIHLIGISDGGTGVYFQAAREVTRWASFLPFIGHSGVLANPSLRVDGQIYVRNFANRPFFIVNAGLDQLYPTVLVLPYLDLMQRAGADFVFRDQPSSNHGTSWWPSEVDRINDFMRAHARDPLPDRLVWETERTDRYNRIHWLVIDEIDPKSGRIEDDELNELRPLPPVPSLGLQPDPNSDAGIVVLGSADDSVAAKAGLKRGDLLVEMGGVMLRTVQDLRGVLVDQAAFGKEIPVIVERKGNRLEKTLRFPPPPPPAKPIQAFPRSRPSGRVVAERHGNDFVVQTRGVRRFSLLLSPDEIDFDRPVSVTADGVEVFRGEVRQDTSTLLEWAVRDQDRTQLYGARLVIDL